MKLVRHLHRVDLILLGCWTLFLLVIGWQDWQNHQRTTFHNAEIEAAAHLALNVAYRTTISNMGGLYADTRRVEPNPYLRVSHRDLQISATETLTLVNPAYMNRLVFRDMASAGLEIVNKITSLKPINPDNAPDSWETATLRSFETGASQAVEVAPLRGRMFLRLMKPFPVVESCLRCHADQGYKVGDIRGGISISIPTDAYQVVEQRATRMTFLNLGMIWVLGCSAMIWAFWKRRLQDLSLLEKERQFRLLSESAQDWELWLTPEGRHLFVSPSVKRLTGYDPEEFFRDPDLLNKLVHGDSQSVWQKHRADCNDSRESQEIELSIVMRDGRQRRFLHLCAPIISDGVCLGRRITHRDITERRQLEDRLRHAQKMEAVGQLAGGIAHDFNNIMAAVMGYANLIEMELVDRPDIMARVRKIVES
ncbi:MAG TPA: DUF3365 domain-containing protein, partial [Candidatus Ozemobacteraceae bacterium]|nr:DUF3365 domain-containing protein [Candidatus Ozemobacteraceae bacterium]